MSGGPNRRVDVVADVQQAEHLGMSHDQAVVSVAKKRRLSAFTVHRYCAENQRWGKKTAPDQTPPPAAPPPPPAETHEERFDRLRREKTLSRELTAYKKRVDDLQEQLDARETLYNTLSSCVRGFQPVPPPKIPPDNTKHPAEMLTGVSDYHSGRVIKKEVMEGLNEYNWEIFLARWWQHVSKTVEIARVWRHAHHIENLRVIMLGDLFNNETRIENIKNNLDWNSRLVFRCASIYAQGLRVWASHFSRLDVVGIVGNESRLPEKPAFYNPTNNWDWVLYQLLRVILDAEVQAGRITFLIPECAAAVVEMPSGNWMFSHGNEIKGGFAGLAYYGMTRRAAQEHELRRPSRWNPEGRDFDYWLFAHFHTATALDHERHFINGAGCGADPHAKTGLGKGGPASQRLMMLTQKYGVTYQAGLQLQEARGHPFIYEEAIDPAADLKAFEVPKL